MDTDLSDLPHAVRRIYGYPDGREGELIVETTHGVFHAPEDTRDYHQPLLLRGRRQCMPAAWDEEHRRWDFENRTTLAWWVDDFRIRFIQRGLGLSCNDLVVVAAGMPSSQ